MSTLTNIHSIARILAGYECYFLFVGVCVWVVNLLTIRPVVTEEKAAK